MYKKALQSKTAIYIILTIMAFTGLIHIMRTNTEKAEETQSVFTLSNKDNIIHEDLDGDSKKDSIIIKNTDNGIIGQVSLNKEETYSLTCHSDLPILGEFSEFWPCRISTIDISRNNSKEIIVQSSFHNKSVQHIFSWTGKNYKDIMRNNNNIIGITDSCNSKSPKVMSGNFEEGKIALKSYVWKENALKEYNADIKTIVPGCDTISNFINLVESFPDPYLSVPNYFYPQISSSDLESVFRIANSNFYLKFQDGYFIDLAWNEKGTITCENWILNFRSIDTANNNNIKCITINIMLNMYNDTDFPYKITSINIY